MTLLLAALAMTTLLSVVSLVLVQSDAREMTHEKIKFESFATFQDN